MSLAAGQTLLHYRLVEQIGEGGMGVVWKAVDTNLDREVAIKVLPDELAQETERLARFEREAKLLATLNHSNIAAVYGLHESGGVRFIAMELVGGHDLATRLELGAIPVDESLDYGRQIAEALEAAHESGVIHRDLKPANIVLTPDGRIKVLDFGLAKALTADPSSGGRSDPSLSPTLTSAGTAAGMILGTATYMSPEQARGRSVDRRCDIWSFGCVLFEMLTANRLFRGETVSDTIALILQSEPDFSTLPDRTPPRVRELITRCLQKDPRRRLRDIGDARIEMENTLAAKEWTGPVSVATSSSAEIPTSSRRGLWLPAALLLAGGLIGAAISAVVSSGGSADAVPLRLSVQSPEGTLPNAITLTPDGRTVVFIGTDEDLDPSEPTAARLFLRPLGESEATPVAGTEGAVRLAISPDGRWLAYVAPVEPGSAQQRLFKMPMDRSSPPLALTDWNAAWSEALLWRTNDEILVSTRTPVSLIRIAADGGEPSAPLETDAPDTVEELFPRDVLPGGIRVLATAYTWEGQGYHDRTYVVNTETGETTKILEDGSSPRWSDTGHLVFSREETLLAVPFDPGRLETTGGPVTLADGLRTGAGDAGAMFDLSPTGTLASQGGGRVGSRRRIAIIGEDGTVAPWSDDRLPFVNYATVSPDGRYLATTVMKRDDLLYSVWVSELDRPRLRQWMEMPGLDCQQPLWLPDGRLVYNCEGNSPDSGIYVAPVDLDVPPRHLWHPESTTPAMTSIHPSGRHVLVDETRAKGTQALRVAVRDGGGSGKAEPLVPDRESTSQAFFSPDGKWVSYFSDDSGRSDLYVASFSEAGAVGRSKLVASAPSGPVFWLETGTPGEFDLAYAVTPGRSEKVRVRTGSRLSLSDPEPFIDFTEIRPAIRSAFPLPDGRFVVVQAAEQEYGTRRIDLVLNFDTELKRLGH